MIDVRLEIDSSLDAVRKISAAIRKACQKSGMSRGEAALVDLAAIEGTTNVIKHAYGGVAGAEVAFHMTIDDEDVAIEISDSGIPINPALSEAAPAVPSFDPEDRDSLPVRGMGLVIMRQVMDEVSFVRRGDHNVLRMRRHRGRASPP